jgi:rubrerythrin
VGVSAPSMGASTLPEAGAMRGQFLGDEICEMAIETERKGAAFYDAVARTATTTAVREFCARMASAEKDHERVFTAMLSLVRGYQAEEESYTGEYLAYVRALLDRDVLPGAEEGVRLAQQAQSEREAIDFAIQFEKSTILFLHEMRNFVPERERGTVGKLLDEERSHVTMLAGLRTRG